MKLIHILFALVSLVTTTVFAAQPAALTPEQQKQIENVIHQYLVKNPDVIIEAVQSLQQKQMDQARKTIKKTEENAPKFSGALFNQPADPSFGNANGKILIVDFFDYQCPHCIKMTPVLETLARGNPDIKIIFKEFPIRGAVSEYASRMALAAKNQGKYFEFHKALMQQAEAGQPLTEDLVNKVAKLTGLNVDKLKADSKSDAISQQLKANTQLAKDLQLLGTPALFIAKSTKPTSVTFVPGQVDQAQLLEVISKTSKN